MSEPAKPTTGTQVPRLAPWLLPFAALCCASVLTGARQVDWGQLLSLSGDAWLTLTASRLPRLAALVLTGVGLSVCGVVLQQIVQNRFVEPATCGGLDAAKLGILVSLTVAPASAFSSDDTAPTTCSPSALPSSTAASPVPPLAPSTSSGRAERESCGSRSLRTTTKEMPCRARVSDSPADGRPAAIRRCTRLGPTHRPPWSSTRATSSGPPGDRNPWPQTASSMAISRGG